MPDHPWNELIVRDGKLLRLSAHAPECQYLNAAKVEILDKLRYEKSEAGQVIYVFAINSETDPTWRACLKSELHILPSGINPADLNVEVRGAELHLRCLPTNLESKLPVVKAAVERANGKYVRHRDEVIERVKTLESGRRQQEEAGKKHAQDIKAQFDGLQI